MKYHTQIFMNFNVTNKKSIHLPLIPEMTCYDLIGSSKNDCQRKKCGQWIDYEKGKNCLMITTQMGPLTLNEIGRIYGLTRMRICQIEKNIYQKIRNFIL